MLIKKHVYDYMVTFIGLVWFAGASPSLKCLIFTSVLCAQSARGPNTVRGGARATELESSGALVEGPLEWVLSLPGPSIMGDANWDVTPDHPVENNGL